MKQLAFSAKHVISLVETVDIWLLIAVQIASQKLIGIDALAADCASMSVRWMGVLR